MGFNSAFKGLMKKCSRCIQPNEPIYVNMINDMMICLLTAIGLTPGGSNTVHIYTQTIHRTTQRKQNIQNRTYLAIRIHKRKNKNT